MNIPLTVAKLYPAAEWGWGGSYVGPDVERYELLDWRDEIQAKPTLAELEVAWPDVEAALLTEQQAADKAEATLAEADAQSAAIPGWATWTEAEVVAYIDTNVVDLASAKAVLRAMARMLVALRNKNWPNLQE